MASGISSEANDHRPLVADGPLAYSSSILAGPISERIRLAGIPVGVSHHGGTYLCNAALYYALHQIASQELPCQAVFVHLPLDITQAAAYSAPIASLPSAVSAQALRIILECLPHNEAMA